MGETKTYAGGCHCGQVRYEVETDLEPVVSCNCSMCSKRGSLLAFASPDRFRALAGEETLTEYRFRSHAIAHLFCPTCGILSYSRGTTPDGRPMVAINVRTIDDIDIAGLQPVAFDGRSL